jgi:CheY-like chemotaxis protein
MPRMDGPTLCARLRAAGYKGPVVLMTSTPHSVPPCLADAVVDKCRLLDDELEAVLDRWLPAVPAAV